MNKVEYNKGVFPLAKQEVIIYKTKMLNWLKQFSILAYLDNNKYQNAPNRYEIIAAAEAVHTDHEIPQHLNQWHFGHIAYNYTEQIYNDIPLRKNSNIPFQNISFFTPKYVLYIPFQSLELHIECIGEDPEIIFKQLNETSSKIEDLEFHILSPWKKTTNIDNYVNKIAQIQQNIINGDYYELNYCVETYSKIKIKDTFNLFHYLNKANPAPFAAYYQINNFSLICTSPERFLYRDYKKLLSQPIKGTAKRILNSKKEDQQAVKALQQDIKERAENLMITDLVRNDLAKSCLPGSITVPELLHPYSFATVHQLISTVQGYLKEELNNQNIIHNSFPMGSMTGAPKKTVIEHIEDYESTPRGLYSGSIGYITPNGNFDFNVVIRSLMHNKVNHITSYHTGGAITFDSIPYKEWEEILIKGNALESVFK